jgi:anti-sigma-K factor RskA
MNEQEFAELSAGHALGALSPEDEQVFLAALRAHPEWLPIADQDRESAATLAEGAPPVAPPVALRSQLLGRIRETETGAEPKEAAETVVLEGEASPAAAPPTEVVQAIQRRNWTRGVFALVASIAVLVGIGWGVGAITDALRTPVAVRTLAQIEAAPDAQSASGELADEGEATVHWAPSLGEAVLVATGLPGIDNDRTFELWYVRDGTPVSAGTFDADDGDATALLQGDMEAGDVIAVTVEPQGGAPGGAPTTEPIVAIPSAEG